MKLSKKTRELFDEYEYESYLTTPEQCMEMLDEYGIAIIPGILDEDECNHIENSTWSHIEKTTTIVRNNVDTWTTGYTDLHKYKMTHEQFVWDVRQNKSVANIFAEYWNCPIEELLVSFEPAIVEFPPEYTNQGWFKKIKFKQNPHRNIKMIRGYITAVDIHRGDSTICIVEKSDKSDDLGIHRRIHCLRGDLILWDNTLLHCDVGAIQGRKCANMRMGINLCYYPRNMTDKITIKRKKKHYTHLRATTHHPVNYEFVEKRREDEMTHPTLSPIGQLLAGF